MTESMRVDLFCGALYGLAMSAGLWAVVLAPPPLDPGCVLLLALCTVLGALGHRLPLPRGVTSSHPGALAALILYGPGASIAAAALAVGSGLLGQHGRKTGRSRHPGLEIVRGTLGGATGAALFLLLEGWTATWPAPAWLLPYVGHAVGYAVAGAAIGAMTCNATGRDAPRRATPWLRVLHVSAYAASVAVAAGVAAIWHVSSAREMLLASIMLLLAAVLHRQHARLRRGALRSRRRSHELYRSINEALARTMEARDPSTQSHLRRVQVLCIEVGRRLGLGDRELDAISAAAVLHDIGKLAVPEGILNKPGRLNEAEMERMRLHPEVGADILEAIPYPYPLGPIVRHHHERWDGGGYPAGLCGEAIPLGSRILSAVDTYDALTSDRPYRKALSHEEARAFLRAESGRMFDPRVIDALLGHVESDRGLRAPDPADPLPPESWDDLVEEPAPGRSLSLAQLELQRLYEISRAVDYGLGLDEYLTLVSGKLAALVPYRSLVVWLLDPEVRLLRAGFTLGQAADKLRLMTIPLGERLSGYAAQQRRSLIGRDHLVPLERDGSRSDLEDWENDDEIALLASTIAAPMVHGDKLVGVLTLYDDAHRVYVAEHRRILTRVAGSVAERAASIAAHVPPAEASLTDPLTGVPNARFLWLETAHRLAQPEPAFGLLAFRVVGLERATERLGNREADLLLCQLARRFAHACGEHETLVRFGHDLFLVLTRVNGTGPLVERWHALVGSVEAPPLTTGEGPPHPIRLLAAHAACPEDGTDVDTLLRTLDSRLALTTSRGRTVLAFRPARASHTNS